jgi:hypothetical protein
MKMPVERDNPCLLPMHRGGWLAYSPLGASLRIGVTGQTEEAARTFYAETWEHWRGLLATDLPQIHAGV